MLEPWESRIGSRGIDRVDGGRFVVECFFDGLSRDLGDVAILVANGVGISRRIDWLFDYNCWCVYLGIGGGWNKYLLIFAEWCGAMENGIEASF